MDSKAAVPGHQLAEPEALDFRALMEFLWRRRWLLLASMLAGAALLSAVAFLSTPMFQGRVVLIPVDRSSIDDSVGSGLGSVSGLASLAGITLPSGNTAVEEALAVLQSRQFTEEFIQVNDLLPVLFWKRWDSHAQAWRRSFWKTPTLWRAFKRFDDLRTVRRDSNTGLITLAVNWKDRAQAAAWANELVRRLNSEMRSRAITKADASLAYLDSELMRTADVGTREAINRLIENQIKQRMFADVTQDYVLRVVDQAMVPDADDPVSPRRALLIASGAVIGLAVGFALTLILRLYEFPQA
jgi:uncharacterized protein involved in exopolysaccharide biosynthesis